MRQLRRQLVLNERARPHNVALDLAEKFLKRAVGKRGTGSWIKVVAKSLPPCLTALLPKAEATAPGDLYPHKLIHFIGVNAT